MCYAASKLWNVCNYERRRYKELGLEKYPDWYYQKKAHKGDLWYRQLPSQTAQETCKQLDKAWKSFYALKKTGGIKAPNPPRFKQDNIPITYMQMGIRHEKGSDQLRLSLSKDFFRGFCCLPCSCNCLSLFRTLSFSGGLGGLLFCFT